MISNLPRAISYDYNAIQGSRQATAKAETEEATTESAENLQRDDEICYLFTESSSVTNARTTALKKAQDIQYDIGKKWFTTVQKNKLKMKEVKKTVN